MKFCENHWADLRKAIEDKGMGHLVAKDGQTALASTVAQLEGTDDNSDFDPLMGCYWRINGEILKIRGFMYMAEDAPHNGCAMCEPDEANPDWAAKWIDGCTNEALVEARLRKLVPEPH